MQTSTETTEYIQGSPEWLALRRTKITATDAAIIMGVSPWKTKEQLLKEKIEGDQSEPNSKMKRGLELEPIARELFTIKTGFSVHPKVVVKDWTMASMDGIQDNGNIAVEIKCPGPTDHALAMSGIIPAHYYPQLQHQMYVCDLEAIFYFSFDGLDGVILEVQRDDAYIDRMLEEEWEFYQQMVEYPSI